MKRERPILTVFLFSAINLFFTVIELLLLLRIILIFFNSDSMNSFVRMIMSWSQTLTAPFEDVFGSISIFGIFTLDFDALLAWFIYLVMYIIIVEVLKIIDAFFIRTRID